MIDMWSKTLQETGISMAEFSISCGRLLKINNSLHLIEGFPYAGNTIKVILLNKAN